MLFRYDERCASFVLAMVDERGHQVVFCHESALSFSRDVLAETARIIRGDRERHSRIIAAAIRGILQPMLMLRGERAPSWRVIAA